MSTDQYSFTLYERKINTTIVLTAGQSDDDFEPGLFTTALDIGNGTLSVSMKMKDRVRNCYLLGCARKQCRFLYYYNIIHT